MELENSLTNDPVDRFISKSILLVNSHECNDRCRIRSFNNCKFLEQSFYLSISNENLELLTICSNKLNLAKIDWNMVDLLYSTIEISNTNIKEKVKFWLNYFEYNFN